MAELARKENHLTQIWKIKRYVRGLRARNAGISLTQPEIAVLDEECAWVSTKIGRQFTRTALVRYVMEEYFQDTWRNATLGHSSNLVPKTPSGKKRGRPRKDAATSPTGPEIKDETVITELESTESVAISPSSHDSNPEPSTPEPATSEAM